MKKKLALVLLTFGIALLFAIPVLAFTSLSGTLVDANGDPWQWGATVYAWDCADGNPYYQQDVISGTNTFDMPITFTNFSQVCYMVIYNDPPPNEAGEDWPAPEPLEGQFTNVPQEGPYSVGATSTGTGPNAVTFAGFSASSNVWLPVGLVVGVSVLAVGTLVILRKRR